MSKLDASNFIYLDFYQDNVFEFILSQIYNCYNKMLNDYTSIENNENLIRNGLHKNYLENNQIREELQLIPYLFDTEVELYNEDDDSVKGRTDIKVYNAIERTKNTNSYYIIECKRIDGTNELNKKYVSNGINRFIENEISLLKLESLRSQMNPHFIFNALNSIKVYLIENDKEKAVYYLNKFSKLIRKILESSRTDSISLEEELEIIELYMSIENIRFDQKIDFSIKRNELNIASIKVPALILQPFIENALWHGLMLKEGEKKITIELAQESNTIKLSITDNGIGRQRAKENAAKKTYKRESLGLQFTNERINHFNQKNHSNYRFTFIDLVDENQNTLGTRVEFVL